MKNDVIFNPKNVHKEAMNSIMHTISIIEALLDDAKMAKSTLSKNALIDVACLHFKKMLDDLALVNKAESNMVSHPKASAAEVKSILKEVGLKDMDDPDYGKEYMIDDEHAIDILENTFKQNKQANNAKTFAKKTRSKSSKVKLQDKA